MPDYTPDQWATLSDLLGEALEHPEPDRDSFIEQRTGSDAQLRNELRRLLAAHDTARRDGRFESGATDLISEAFPEPAPVEQIGPYRLLREIGRGGMGRVWLAERSDGVFDRRVAVKMMRAGLMLQADRERFAAERHILGRLDHENVAGILDGGITDDGHPYLVMEYVEGVPITEYCRANSSSLEERLQLLRTVCDAVSYAHQKLVVHRDLKPGNILVREDGTVKLLDFGIAKLLNFDQVEDARLTLTGALRLTPEYAAPEQVLGGGISTATDVYALGIILFELLTGERPYSIEGQSPRAIEAAVCNSRPPRPSTVVRTADRETSASTSRLARRLRGDLDTIVLKALRKEPERRYATAAELSEDLRRYLVGLPVSARPDTAAYRTKKFVQRHRVSVAAAGVVALALLFGLGAASWQAWEANQAREVAEERFAIAQEAAQSLLYSVHDAIAGLPGSTAAREIIVAHSVDYLDRLATDAGDDLELRLDLAGAYFRIANVQGNPTDNNLGRHDDAIASYRRGLDLLPNPSGLSDKDAARVHSLRGRLLEKLGVVVAHVEAPEDALGYLREAVRAQEQAIALVPGDAFVVTLLAASHINLADYSGHPYFPNAGQQQEALDGYQRAESILSPIVSEESSLFTQRMFGITFERRGSIYRDQGDFERAIEVSRRALDVRRHIAARPDSDVDAHRDVGVSLANLGRVYLAQGSHEDAIEHMEAAQYIYDTIASNDPESVFAQHTRALGHLNLGRAYGEAGRRTEARTYLRYAEEALTSVSERAPANLAAARHLDQTRSARQEFGQ